MSNKSGWLNSVGLIASRVAGLGNDVHRALAGEFPEAEIDRIRAQPQFAGGLSRIAERADVNRD